MLTEYVSDSKNENIIALVFYKLLRVLLNRTGDNL